MEKHRLELQLQLQGNDWMSQSDNWIVCDSGLKQRFNIPNNVRKIWLCAEPATGAADPAVWRARFRCSPENRLNRIVIYWKLADYLYAAGFTHGDLIDFWVEYEQ